MRVNKGSDTFGKLSYVPQGLPVAIIKNKEYKMEYNGKKYQKLPAFSELSCEGCVFRVEIYRTKNVGTKTNPVYKEFPTGYYGCEIPSSELIKHCKVENIIYKEV